MNLVITADVGSLRRKHRGRVEDGESAGAGIDADVSSDNGCASFGSKSSHHLLKARVNIVEGRGSFRPCNQISLRRRVSAGRNYRRCIRFRKAAYVGAAGLL